MAKLALGRSLVSLGLVGILESRNALRQRIERLLDFTAPRRAGLSVVSLVTLAAFAAVAVPMGKPPPVARDSIVLSQRDNSDLTNTVPDVTKGEASNLATSTESAITELKTKFRGADVQTRRNALRIFAFSSCVVPESANPSLREALPILIQAAKDEDPLIRHYAAIALWKLRSPDEMVIETLGNLVVVETDLETANVAAAALKEVGPSAAPAVANLIRALECRKEDGTFIPGSGNQIEPNISLGTGLRRCVIEALGNIGPAAQSAVPALHKLLHDTGEFSHGSQVFSAKALWQITGKTNEALPILIRALKVQDSASAADILAIMGADAEPAIPALQHLIQSPVGIGYTRLHAAIALHKIDSRVPLPMPLLLSLLKDQVRQRALRRRTPFGP